MAKLADNANENLHRVMRHLSMQYDRTLTISDTINFLSLYYVKHGKIENLDIECERWQITDINGDDETNEGEVTIP